MTNVEFAGRAREIAEKYSTVYMLGTWGWPATEINIERAVKQYSNNARYLEKAKKAGENSFMFDCCGLAKGILWGWGGDKNDVYGGAPYMANDVPDVNEDGLLKLCIDVSDNFENIGIGDYLWLKGHCGIYIGNGLVVEATPAFNGGVQITALGNIGTKAGYNVRTWSKRGRLPYIKYISESYGRQVEIALNELFKGSRGNQVRTIQQLLIARGYPCGEYGADGEFGEDTYKAVINFQKYNKECGDADGIVGIKTWKTILG